MLPHTKSGVTASPRSKTFGSVGITTRGAAVCTSSAIPQLYQTTPLTSFAEIQFAFQPQVKPTIMSYNTNCVYIVASLNNKVVYTGVTSNLLRRVAEHREGKLSTFTGKYKLYKLVYFECGGDIMSALNREKQIKANSRAYKEKLIRSLNPDWKDLAEDWF